MSFKIIYREKMNHFEEKQSLSMNSTEIVQSSTLV